LLKGEIGPDEVGRDAEPVSRGFVFISSAGGAALRCPRRRCGGGANFIVLRGALPTFYPRGAAGASTVIGIIH